MPPFLRASLNLTLELRPTRTHVITCKTHVYHHRCQRARLSLACASSLQKICTTTTLKTTDLTSKSCFADASGSAAAIDKHGTDVNAPDRSHKTPLLLALTSASPETMRLLIEHKIEHGLAVDGNHRMPCI